MIDVEAMTMYMTAACMLIDFITFIGLGAKYAWGAGEARPVGILLIVVGFFHFLVGAAFTFLCGDGYTGFLVWVFSFTFTYAGICIGWELEEKALGNALFALGTIILVYTIDYALTGHVWWTAIMAVFVGLYYLFVFSCYGKVADRPVGYCVLFGALVCLLGGAPYIFGIQFL